MNEQVEQIETAATPLSLHGIGRLLAEARERAGLTLEDAAAQLRLGARQVKALEAGDMEALPGPAFVRGFIRNYAKLLRIDAGPLLDAYRAHAPGSSHGQISLHSENIPIVGRERRAWQPFAAAAVALGLALGGGMAYLDYVADQGEKPVPAAAALPPPLPKPAATPPTLPAEPPSPAPAATPPAAEGLGVLQPPTTAAPPLANATLRLSFSQAGWVSVRDRDDREIFNKTPPAGSSEVVEGLPPLSVVLGNAGGVQLTFNDKPVDLVPHTTANVARLTLE